MNPQEMVASRATKPPAPATALLIGGAGFAGGLRIRSDNASSASGDELTATATPVPRITRGLEPTAPPPPWPTPTVPL
jgi:hypothetical protein